MSGSCVPTAGFCKQAAIFRIVIDARGIPYIVLTCTECLRSFPLNVSSEVTATVMETPCIFCLSEVRYIIDFSLSVASPKKKMATLLPMTVLR